MKITGDICRTHKTRVISYSVNFINEMRKSNTAVKDHLKEYMWHFRYAQTSRYRPRSKYQLVILCAKCVFTS